MCFFPGGAGAWAAPVELGSGGGGRHSTELRSAWENVKQLLWPLLSACQSRSVDLELQLKGLLVSPILLGFEPINLSNLFRLNYLISFVNDTGQ